MTAYLHVQETPFILACSNINYLRFGNVKFADKSLTLRDLEEDQTKLVELSMGMTRS